MISASSFRLFKLDLLPALGRAVFRKTRLQLVRTPLSVERLEDRTVPAPVNFLGSASISTVNPDPGSNGLIVATPANTSSIAILFGTAGLSVLAFPVPQGQQSAVIQPLWNPGAFGFGSGVQPGQPWAPAAYTIGLANRPFSDPTTADHGYQPTPPWSQVAAYDQNRDGIPRVRQDNQQTESGSAPVNVLSEDYDQGQEGREVEDKGDSEAVGSPVVEPIAQALPFVPPAALGVSRGTAAIEAALFADAPSAPKVTARESSPPAATSSVSDDYLLLGYDGAGWDEMATITAAPYLLGEWMRSTAVDVSNEMAASPECAAFCSE